MKKTLLIVSLAGLVYICACQDHSGKKVQLPGISTERGHYLVETVANCMHCHSQRDFTKFSGPLKEETKGMGGVGYPKFGVLFSSNITPDTATGIGGWTDEEVARAITQGISKNGDTLFPIMPYYEYNKMCREDVYSMIAYLRTLKPIVNKIQERKLKSPAGPEHDQFKYVNIDDNRLPTSSDRIETGKYLATVAACVSCHTAKTEEDRFLTAQYYGGGDMMGKKFGFTVYSSNITPDSATGIGTWSAQDFVNKFESYRKPAAYEHDPGKYNTMMPWNLLCQLKEEDLQAIYAYLRTVRPVSNKVTKWPEEKQEHKN